MGFIIEIIRNGNISYFAGLDAAMHIVETKDPKAGTNFQTLAEALKVKDGPCLQLAPLLASVRVVNLDDPRKVEAASTVSPPTPKISRRQPNMQGKSGPTLDLSKAKKK